MDFYKRLCRLVSSDCLSLLILRRVKLVVRWSQFFLTNFSGIVSLWTITREIDETLEFLRTTHSQIQWFAFRCHFVYVYLSGTDTLSLWCLVVHVSVPYRHQTPGRPFCPTQVFLVHRRQTVNLESWIGPLDSTVSLGGSDWRYGHPPGDSESDRDPEISLVGPVY